MSIRKRLFLLVLTVWLPAASGFGILLWHMLEKELTAMQGEVENYGVAVNTLVERELDKRVVLAQTLAASTSLQDQDFARFHREAQTATTGTGNWALLANEDWHLVNTLAPLPFQPVRRAKSVRLSESAPNIVFVAEGPVAKKAAITVFVPVPGLMPQAYNVGVSFEPSVIQELFRKMPENFKGVATVVNAEQIIMARSRDPEQWFGVSASQNFKTRILNKGLGFAESVTLDGIPSLTFLTPPNVYGWSVVVAVPKQVIDAAAHQTSAKALAAAAALLGVGLAFAIVGARRISSTVHLLQDAASQLGNNKVPAVLRTGVSEVDEVGQALHVAGVKAHEANDVLERRVQLAVSETQEAQAKLLHSQQLELVGRLTAGVSHDFNNLLQTISTAHYLLSKRITEGPERRTLEGAVRATSKGRDLVNRLSTFGRAQEPERVRVNLADVVLKSEDLTSAAVGKSIVLEASLEPNLPDLYVDPLQLEMALLNIVFNARDALPAGGHITISGRVATAHETQAFGPGMFVCLEVADDGTGMSEEVRARAFEPYYSTKPVGLGTGIGLAQVQSFARQSGGETVLMSQLGSGTRVRLFLPIATDETAPVNPVAPGKPEEHRALKILMVEDDPLVSSITLTALEDSGYSVRLCHTADEAVQVLCTDEQFDVIFTDVVMPGTLNGLDLVRWCLLNRPEIPALVATGYSENLSSVSAPVLRKPYDIDALVRALSNVAKGQP